MKNLTLETAAEVTGAVCGALPQVLIAGIVTDSREAVQGSLFAAIPGARSDGHDFVRTAREKGALAALCQHKVNDPLPQLIVPDTQKALGSLAAWYRTQFAIPMVGVTGSVGKTTAKEMIAAVLAQRFVTHKTFKNKNNELGVPLTLFGLREEHQAAVVEMGISGFGEMTRLARMVQPDIAVFTLIGDAHLEFLGDRAGVLRAKAEIVNGMGPDGLVIANGDDALLRNYDFGRKTLTFGFGKDCQVRAENVRDDGLAGISCDIIYAGRRLRSQIPAFGRHMVYAALMGAAVGFALGLTDGEIIRGLTAYQAVDGRAVPEKLGSVILINDCYNSNPTSARASLDELAELPGRKVCILGDMRELGEESPALHRALGAYASEKGIAVIACGALAKQIAEGGNGRWFSDLPALLEALPEIVRPGDAVLVKASRAMQFEAVCEALRTGVF